LGSRGWLALGLALVLGIVDWVAVARRNRRLEYVFKPATLVAVIAGAWLLTRGPHDTWQASLFLPALALSLAGDIFLMLPTEHFFLLGLLSFLLAHVCYIVGLNPTLPPWPSPTLLVPVAAVGATIYRNIAAGMRRRGRETWLVPVAIYSTVLSLMLFSAWATLLRPEWTPTRRAFVIAGASLFFASDVLNAWDRFVAGSDLARLCIMVTYHLGQIALAACITLA